MTDFANSTRLSKGRLALVILGIAGIWLMYCLLYTLLIVQSGSGGGFSEILTGQISLNLIRAFYILPVWWLMARSGPTISWLTALPLHVVGALAYAWLGLQTLLVQARVLGGGENLLETLEGVSQWIFLEGLTLYVIQVSLFQAWMYLRRIRQRDREAAELLALARTRELAALKAQINPHFLFNSLNTISALIHTNPEGAREMISELASLMRYALASSRRELVPLSEEVAFARQYLKMESNRFPDRLHVEMDVPDELMDHPVPPMLLQPLVENSIKHGIAPTREGGTVAIKIARGDGLVECTIEDSGLGGDPSSSGSGIGIANTRDRLLRTYGDATIFEHGPMDPRGYRVHFTIPDKEVAP